MQFSLQHLSTTEEYPACIMTALLVTWMGFSSQHSTSVLEVERILLCSRTFCFFWEIRSSVLSKIVMFKNVLKFDFEDFVALWTIFIVNNVQRTVWFLMIRSITCFCYVLMISWECNKISWKRQNFSWYH